MRVARLDPPADDPVNRLYDHGADLVDAARCLHERAAVPSAARAAAAVLACLEQALRELNAATGELERAAVEAGDAHAARRVGRMQTGFANLEVALLDAADAAAAARALVARAMAEGP